MVQYCIEMSSSLYIYFVSVVVVCLQVLQVIALDDANDGEDVGSRSQGPPYTTCNHDCQNQVKILEGFIALVMLGCGLGVGICCLKCINTPTAFASSAVTVAKKRD